MAKTLFKLPSIFDVAVMGILGVTFLSNQFLQGTYFIFYSLFIFSLTLLMKSKREYVSIPLALLVLWSFAMIFNHNKIEVVLNSIVNYYFNVSIMFEGFIYILSGVLLFTSIIKYSKNPKFIFCVLPIFLIPLITSGIYAKNISTIAALVVSTILYLFVTSRFLAGFLIITASGIASLFIWPHICMKFICRPYIWIELGRQVLEHPFVGKGFNHSLVPDNMIWIRKIGSVVYGWLYAHNDYLNLASCLGAIVLIFIAWFIVDSLKRIGRTIYLIPFLAIVILSFFQITMFQPDKAVICLVIGAVCIKETYKKGE